MTGPASATTTASSMRIDSAPPPTLSAVERQIVSAWQSRQLTDGTRLNLGRVDREQMFAVTPDGTSVVPARTGTQICSDGSSRTIAVTSAQLLAGRAGGHTHPRGSDVRISPLPGPDDGRMAVVTGQDAYMISSRGAFAISRDADGFSVRILAGEPLSPIESGEIARNLAAWNANNGGSGVTCRTTFN
jgi:hypothetical protein